LNILKLTKSIFFLLILISFSAFSQKDTIVDSDKKKEKKVILALPSSKEIKKPKSLKNDNENGFKKAYAKKKEADAKKKKEEDLKNKGILTAAKISEERFLKSWKKINAPYPVIDQDLGSFRTQSKSVRIICRDFQYPDGDRVTIMINDIPVIRNITLKRAYQAFDLPLQVGLNKIAFIALNQGTSGPNTAGFKVFDDSGNVISSNEWNLATGAKATILIAKDK
tara:strand:- start:17650 stop:18321 length:672 start_codon:yes stop_codon:yes gene_type:complete